MEGTWKELRCFREYNKTRYREQNNRTIGIRKYLRWDLTTLGNRVRSGHPCTGLRSGYFGFLGFPGVARKLVKVSEIAEMPQEIAREALGSAWEPQEGYRTFLSLVRNVLRVLQDVTPPAH